MYSGQDFVLVRGEPGEDGAQVSGEQLEWTASPGSKERWLRTELERKMAH